ncbi:MAG: hypothetical protein V1753_11905 [Pseudomonadota bacterium]
MRLARREKYVLAGIALIVFTLALFELVITPFTVKWSRLEAGILKAKNDIKAVVPLRKEYDQVRESTRYITEALAKRPAGFSLFAHLEKIASETDTKGNIQSMKPSSSATSGPYVESTVEIELSGITLDQLKNYLYIVEDRDKCIWIKSAVIKIKTQKQAPRYLDVVLQVMTISEEAGGEPTEPSEGEKVSDPSEG